MRRERWRERLRLDRELPRETDRRPLALRVGEPALRPGDDRVVLDFGELLFGDFVVGAEFLEDPERLEPLRLTPELRLGDRPPPRLPPPPRPRWASALGIARSPSPTWRTSVTNLRRCISIS